jgi:tRNA-splicing ligase RtcB
MSYVDEAPGAYKDVEKVISRQMDLVEIVHTLKPIITVKGDSRAKDD